MAVNKTKLTIGCVYVTDKELTMDIHELQGNKYILWGFNSSLYSGKMRPYLVKKGIDFIELNPSHPHFNEKILPRIAILPFLS